MPRSSPVPLLLLALLPCALRLLYYPGYPGADDAYIHLAIVESLWRDGTWGIQPNDPVPLSTSPLFTAFFAALAPFVSSALQAGMILSCMATGGVVLLSHALSLRLGHPRNIALAIAACSATNVHLWRWGGTFMEVSFAACGLLFVLWFLLGPGGARREVLAGIATGGLILLRPETGLILPALFLQDQFAGRAGWAARQRRIWLGAALPLLVYAILAWREFGTVLPSTYAAKTSLGLRLWNPEALRGFLLVVGSAFPALVLLGLLLLGSSWLERPGSGFRSTRVERPLLVFLLFPALHAGFVYLSMPVLQSPSRYFLPTLVCLPFLLASLVRRLERRWRSGVQVRRWVRVALVGQVALALALNHVRVAPVLSSMRSEYVATMTDAADEIAHHAGPDQTVLVDADIGVVSWRLNGSRRLADGGALASPELGGLELPAMLRATGAEFLLDSLGSLEDADRPIDLPPLELLWERSFRSHGVARADAVYTARLYRVLRESPSSGGPEASAR